MPKHNLAESAVEQSNVPRPRPAKKKWLFNASQLCDVCSTRRATREEQSSVAVIKYWCDDCYRMLRIRQR